MGKMNKKGRSKFEAHIRLHRGVTNTEAWKSLSCTARALLIEIWCLHNGSNNGRIGFSVRMAKASLHIGSSKAPRAFKELEEKGFLICRYRGRFDAKVNAGEGRASEWEITAERCGDNPPKRTYRDWVKK
jgi:hypothetical protein